MSFLLSLINLFTIIFSQFQYQYRQRKFQMGQSTSTQEMRFSTLLNNYAEDIRCEFGTILKHKQNFERFLLREISLMDQNEYNSALEKYIIKKNHVKQNILNLMEVEGRIKTNFCSGSYKIFLIFEFSSITLCQEIKARAVEFRHFEEQDLWSIMQSCLNGIEEVNTQTILLDPKKIFIMTDGLIKLIDPSIDNDGSKFLLEEEIYYAPQRYENFSNCDRGTFSEKQTMFSLGMILLNSCILDECFDCYEEENLIFNATILSQKIDKLKSLYSQQLVLIIESILQIDPSKRLSMIQLQQAINKFWIPGNQFDEKQQQKQSIEGIEQIEEPQKDTQMQQYESQKQKAKEKKIKQQEEKEKEKIKQKNKQQFNRVIKFKENSEILPNKIAVSEIIDKDKVINQISCLRREKVNFGNQSQETQQKLLLRHQKSQSENIIKINNNNNYSSYITNNQSNFMTFNNQQLQIAFRQQIHNNNIKNSNYNQQITYIPNMNNNYSFYKCPETHRQENTTDRIKFENYQKIYPENNQNLFTDPKLLEICRKDVEELNQRKSFQQSSFHSQIYISQPPFKQSIIKNITNTHQQNRNNASTSSDVSPAALLKKPAKSFFNPIYTNSSQKPEAQFVIEIYDDGRKYEGNIVNGIKQGNGKLIYADGAYYQGNFFDNKMQGLGVLYYRVGKPAYQGYWNDDQFHGYGTLYNETPIRMDGSFDFQDFNQVEDFWSRYQGNFQFDNKCGMGKLFLANGEYFQGEFDRDCINGKGRFHDRFGKVHQGIWRDNIFQQYL